MVASDTDIRRNLGVSKSVAHLVFKFTEVLLRSTACNTSKAVQYAILQNTKRQQDSYRDSPKARQITFRFTYKPTFEMFLSRDGGKERPRAVRFLPRQACNNKISAELLYLGRQDGQKAIQGTHTKRPSQMHYECRKIEWDAVVKMLHWRCQSDDVCGVACGGPEAG